MAILYRFLLIGMPGLFICFLSTSAVLGTTLPPIAEKVKGVPSTELARVYFQYGEWYLESDPVTGVDFLTKSIEHAMEHDQTTMVISAVKVLVTYWQRDVFSPETSAFLQRALDYLKEKQLSNKQVLSVYSIGNLLMDAGRLQFAQSFFQFCILQLPNETDNAILIESLNNIGIIYYKRSQLDAAKPYLEQVINSSAHVEKLGVKAKALEYLGKILRKQGNFSRALNLFLDALVIYEQLNMMMEASRTLVDVGLLYREWNQPVRAIEYLNKALRASRQVSDLPEPEANILTTMSKLYTQVSEFDRALATANRTLEIREANNLPRSGTLNAIAAIYYQLKQYDLAISHLDKAQEANVSERDKLQTMINNYYRSSIYLSRGEYAVAEGMIDDGLIIGETLNEVDWVIKILKLKAQTQIGQQLYESANRTYGTIINLQEQYELEKRDMMFASIESSMQNRMRDLEIARLKKERNLNQIQMYRSKDSLRILFILMLVSLLVHAYFIFNLFRNRHKMEKLKEKNGELNNVISTFEQHKIIDPLVKIPNKSAMENFLQRESEICDAYEYNFATLLIDVDNFSKVNVSYGQQTGDLVLSSIASKISSIKRPEDYFGRWYGADFIYIMHKSDSMTGAVFAEEIKLVIKKMRIEFEYGGKAMELAMTASVGVSTYLESKSNIKHCLSRAQKALQHGKAYGSDHVSLATLD